MIPSGFLPIANHLWQSTLFATVAGLLTLVLRKNGAQTRYWLWLAASVKFLIPLSVLVMAGSLVARKTSVTIPQLSLSSAIEQVSQPFGVSAPIATIQAAQPSAGLIPAILFAVWAIGFVALVSSWWLRWRRLRGALRTASPLCLNLPIQVMSSPAFPEPGVVGIRRPVLLLPEGIARRLTPPQMEAILEHELCHVRRRDNLTAVVHMAVEAVFWFHPLVWWLGARLMEERERACDEEVLRTGREPQVYAEGILKICELYMESPLPCVAGVTGANLKKRIETIMNNRIALRLNFGRKLLLATAGLLAGSGPILMGLVNGPPAKAQSQTPLAFEVASVKPQEIPPGAAVFGSGGTIRISGNAVTIRGSLTGLVMSAYNLKEFQVSGAPGWNDKLGRVQLYEIIAKADGEGALSMDRARQMLQTLLADRFQLKLHRGSKEMSVYDLVVGKNGPKLKEASADTKPATDIITASTALMRFKYSNRSMADLIGVLLTNVDRPVIDKTGLTGGYDFTLEYTRSNPDFVPIDSPDADKSIFSAVQEQLGLRLAAAREPVEILVIDGAERPSDN